jgi:hypothetical protein
MEIPESETLVAVAEPDTVDKAEAVMETAISATMEFADIF